MTAENDAFGSGAPAEPRPDAAAAQQLLMQAIAAHRQGDVPQAQLLYRQVLAIDAGQFDALHMLGVIALQGGDCASAIDVIGKAIRSDGTSARAHYNLGNALRQAGRHAEALASYDRALALNPDNARAHNNRANALRDLKRDIEAVRAYDQAIALNPDFAEALHNRGNALNDLGRREEAIVSYQRALAAGGDTARLTYELSALGVGNAPAAAPPQYVVNVFDAYADRFDQHLVGSLQYQTPALVAAIIQRLVAVAPMDILDLGCGTGLCGPLLHPFARTLTGVDLSAKMLGKARERGVYDELVCGEITQYLAARDQVFDGVVATDVFVYIGDLSDVFKGVRRALKAGGWFAFSVEESTAAEYVLRVTKRYAHTAAYLQRLAGEHGFQVACIDRAIIRKDGNDDVPGLIVLLRL